MDGHGRDAVDQGHGCVISLTSAAGRVIGGGAGRTERR